jgi:hypothetical protein
VEDEIFAAIESHDYAIRKSIASYIHPRGISIDPIKGGLQGQETSDLKERSRTSIRSTNEDNPLPTTNGNMLLPLPNAPSSLTGSHMFDTLQNLEFQYTPNISGNPTFHLPKT